MNKNNFELSNNKAWLYIFIIIMCIILIYFIVNSV